MEKHFLVYFFKIKYYGMIGGFDASKLLLKSLLPIRRPKQSVSLKLSYYRPQGYHNSVVGK